MTEPRLRRKLRSQLEKPVVSQEFLAQLIGAFVSQVHFGVWSCPKGIEIAPKP